MSFPAPPARRAASPTFTEISSGQNPRYRHWLKLLDARGIRKTEEAVIAGRKVLEEILLQFPERISAVVAQRAEDLTPLPLPPETPAYLVPPALFARLDIYGTKAPLLIIKAPPLPRWDETLRPGLTLFLPFQNPINLGTTIRSAAALGAEVVLLEEAASPYLPKSLRASGPAIFQTPIYQGPDLKSLAALAGTLPLYALSPRGHNIYTFDFPDTVGMVAGMEGPGLDDVWPATNRLSIPMQPNVESLNAAIAVGMGMACLYAQRCRR